jgi:phosphopantetheine adenylyltransferase
MFDDSKKQVNEMRKRNGLDELRMYSNPYLKRYIKNRINISEKTMKKAVEIMGY